MKKPEFQAADFMLLFDKLLVYLISVLFENGDTGRPSGLFESMICGGKGSPSPHGKFKVGSIIDRESVLAS